MRRRTLGLTSLLAASAASVAACGSTEGSWLLDGGLDGAISRDASVSPWPRFDAGVDAAISDAAISDAAVSDAAVSDAAVSDAAVWSVDAGRGDAGGWQRGSYIIGADVSWVPEDESQGARFVDTDGAERDILTLLERHGFNFIRLRTFVDPSANDGYSASGFCDLGHTVAMAQRVKRAGLGLLIDLHYSDNWADPTKQCIPVAWQGDSVDQMARAVHDYTREVLSALSDAGAMPDMVQIGNEITPGMLLHACDSTGTPQRTSTVNGSTSNWANLAKFLKAGIQAVHEANPAIVTVIHLDRGGNASDSAWWIKNARANGVQFDVLAQSCYVAYQGQPSTWKSTLEALATDFPELELAIAEYNNEAVSSPAGATSMRAANDIVFGLAARRGLGTFFWEPTHSGGWGNGLFSVRGNVRTAIPDAMSVYDSMKGAYQR